MTSVQDASGLREMTYDAFGRMIQDTSFAQMESCLLEDFDSFGRPSGYRLMIGTRTVQQSHLNYDREGGIFRMNLEGLASPFTWDYDKSSGFLNRLTYPNGMVRSNTYHPKLNLLASIGYGKEENGGTVAGHEYEYDALMRPTQRRDSWDSATPAMIREFTYNTRSELIKDQIRQGGKFSYQYDNIGNRKNARELEEEVSYEANSLNQYAEITGDEAPFTPTYDTDGNQTCIKTSTGIWEVSYDANDRPVFFTSKDGRTIIECGYDYRGRRFEKKVIVNGSLASHAWYLYRDYLQLAELNLMHPEPELVKSYLWDPTESVATRVLMMTTWKINNTKEKEHFCFMHDALKNVTSIFDEQQTRRAHYEYAPFGGLITAEENMAQKNNFRFSCEHADDKLGLVYYNYRHLNPTDGRWINRDPIAESGGWNLYGFINNNIENSIDNLGRNRLLKTSYVIHEDVQIDDWLNLAGKWVKNGSRTWSFGPIPGVLNLFMTPFYAKGNVFSLTENGSVIGGRVTTPCDDMFVVTYLEELLKTNPHGYNILIFNCRHFAEYFYGPILDAERTLVMGKCCNPDGSEWKS